MIDRPDWDFEVPTKPGQEAFSAGPPAGAEPAELPPSAPAAPAREYSAASAELDEIDAFRREHKSAYFKDAALQARERELIEAELAEEPEPAAEPASLSADLIERWNTEGFGAEAHQAAAQGAVLDVLADMGDDGAALVTGFEALPDGVQSVIFNELSLAPPAGVAPASEDALAAFGELEEGARLLERWGADAPARLGIVRARIDAVMEGLTEGGKVAAAAWLDALPPDHAFHVMRALAGDPSHG